MAHRHTPDDRLDGWEAIADYMGWTPRTVIRWEKQKGLPIHRLSGGKRQPVYAFRREIDEWFQKTGGSGVGVLAAPTQPWLDTKSIPPSEGISMWRVSSRAILWTAATAILLVAGLGIAWRVSIKPLIQITGQTQLTDDDTEKEFLVTDGKQLYFSEYFGDERVLSTVAADGGPIRRISLPFPNPIAEDITADGKFLLVLSTVGAEEVHSLWIVPTSGSSPYQLANVKCQSAAWSPNGEWIAIGTGTAIYLVSRDSSHTELLAKLDGLPEAIRWSPNGKQLLVSLRHLPTNSTTLWQVNLDRNFNAASAIPLQIADKQILAHASLARAKDGYFFISDDSKTDVPLYLRQRPWWMGSEFEASTLSSQFNRIIGIGADSNARRLFIVSGEGQHGELVRYDLSTRSFTLMLPGASASYVDQAKNMQMVAYVSSQDRTLQVSRLDGTDRNQLSPAGMNAELPRWSPDGRWIAFMGQKPTGPWRIFIVSAAGGVFKEASQSDDSQGAPSWSPDGKHLVYGNVDCQVEETCAIHRIDLESGKVTTLPGSQGLGTARWSPDGQHISALNPAQHKLLVFDVGKRKWRVLAEKINGNDVSWSSDSRFVYTKSSMSGHSEILRVDVSSGAVQTVLNLDSFGGATGQLDTWFSLTPDNALLLNRWLNTSEIYALNYREQ
jgi:dipeptidyl aminopeptidase/acylaminoacyl peptidase